MAMKTTANCRAMRAAAPSRSTVVCRASAEPASRRQLLGLGAAVFGLALAAAPAKADITADLLAKSAANKALNDKKRLATSSANVARSRTVTDGTCGFPNNFFGCEETSANLNGGVKFIQDDVELECEGSTTGRCASKANMNFGAKGF